MTGQGNGLLTQVPAGCTGVCTRLGCDKCSGVRVTHPNKRRSCSCSVMTSKPATDAVPDVGMVSPDSIFSVDVLPAPLMPWVMHRTHVMEWWPMKPHH